MIDAKASAAPALGAYGLRLRGLEGATRWMQDQALDAPSLTVEVIQTSPDTSTSVLDGQRADIRLLDGGRLQARHGEGAVRFALPRVPAPAELVHPYLAPAAALMWQWAGREALHGGAVDLGAGAVLVFGAKEAGKSSLLACLAQDYEKPVIADDLAVIDGGRVLGGPRSIDLRQGKGAAMREGQRVRLDLPAGALRTAVIGSVVLRWGARLEITPVDPAQRLALLAAHRTYRALPCDPKALLDLAARPMVILRRPRELAQLRAAATALLKRFA